jgi:hypothetical protein
MRESSRRSFLRLPPTRPELALRAIGHDPGRVPARRRTCEHCGQPIPPERGASARFCDERCQRTHWRERHPATLAPPPA